MGKLTIVCAWCNKNLGSTNEPSLTQNETSHGMCSKCADKQRNDAKEYIAKAGKK